MDISSLTTDPEEAKAKWHEYKDAYKATRKPADKIMTKVYAHVKMGRKVVEISSVISKGGIRWEGEKDSRKIFPNLAIAKATSKHVFVTYYNNGRISFRNGEYWQHRTKDIMLPAGTLKSGWGATPYTTKELKAPVPKIPHNVFNKKLQPDHYILWEVDAWEEVPSIDPILLKRLHGNLFIYLTEWKLTEIEALVLKQFM